MPDADQCPSHTRTPWGKSHHRLRPSLRHLAMGLLLFAFIAVVVLVLVFVIGHSTFWADHEDEKLDDATAAGGIAFVMDRHHRRELGDGRLACEELVKGCVAEGRSGFRCPHGTVCQNNAFSASGISCCPPSAICDLNLAPYCTAGTFIWPASLGGGCCPSQSICSLGGCLTAFLAPPRLDDEKRDGNTIGKAQIPTVVKGDQPTTVGKKAMVTHTGAKFGELGFVSSKEYEEKFVRAGESRVIKPGDPDGGVVVETEQSGSSANDDNNIEQEKSSSFVANSGSAFARLHNPILLFWTRVFISGVLADATFSIR